MWNSAQVFQSNGLSFSRNKLFFAKTHIKWWNLLRFFPNKLKISGATLISFTRFFPQHFLHVSCFILVNLHLILFQVTFPSTGPPVCNRPALTCCTCVPSPGLFRSASSLCHILFACVRVSAFQFCPLLFSFAPPLSCFDWWLTYQPDLRLIQSALWIR